MDQTLTQGAIPRARGLAIAAVIGLVAAACGGGASPSPTPATTPAPTEAMPSEVAATGTPEPTFPMTVDAGYGAVTLDAPPERIYAWGFQPMDELAALGVEPAGYSSRNGGTVPDYLGVSWSNAVQLGEPPSLEEIVAINPDLIISDNSNDNSALESLEVPIFKIRANSLSDAFDQLALIGQITGTSDKADQFTADFTALLEDTQAKIGAQEPVTSMIVYPGVDPGILGMWLDNSFIGTLVASLGTDYGLKESELSNTDLQGDNADRASNLGLVQLGLEKVVQVDPDVLFVLGTEDFVNSLSENPAWATITAVKNDAVYTFDRDLWSRDRGPVAAKLVVQQAAHALYPDIFPMP